VRIATLDLTPELFVEFCKFCKDGPLRLTVVRENPLPDDAKIIGCRTNTDHWPMTLKLVVESATFADVFEGEKVPELPLVMFETIYDNPYDHCKGGCGISFNEFPEMRHTEDECPGPECTCYEVIGGHQMGCYFYSRAAS
jgi:hypothetical protein